MCLIKRSRRLVYGLRILLRWRLILGRSLLCRRLLVLVLYIWWRRSILGLRDPDAVLRTRARSRRLRGCCSKAIQSIDYWLCTLRRKDGHSGQRPWYWLSPSLEHFFQFSSHILIDL